MLVAMGLTTLYLLWLLKPALEPQQIAFYHWSAPASNFFLPVALDFLGFWFLLTLLLLATRLRGRVRATLWTALLSFIPWAIVQNLHLLELAPRLHQLDRCLFLTNILATLLVIAFWRPAFVPRFERVIESASTVLVFLGLFGVFLILELAFISGQASWKMRSTHFYLSATTTVQPHRILWIVFDELSYQQAFEHRFPDLKLPAFDSLASTSTVFTQAQPFDIYTQNVLPGLLSGKRFDQTRTHALELSLHNQATGKWQRFDQQDTVFQDALRAGYRTAVVGWYNPYCRIVPAVLDSCYWANRSPTNYMKPSNSLLANILAPMKLYAWSMLGPTPGPVFFYFMHHLHISFQKVVTRQSQIDDYNDLDTHAQNLLRDQSFNFILLHLPVPHPPGIYDRRANTFTTSDVSYMNNLALADKCLAGIRKTLEQTGQWDSSTIVVMGDHSWRTKQIWRSMLLTYWTPEDELASNGGQYDPRPAYLVKLPNQTSAARIDTPFQTVNTRKLFDALMAHQINTPTDLVTWAQTTH